MTVSHIKLHFVVSLFFVVLSTGSAQESSPAVPEAAFLSADKYTNAFFGFSLPLPRDPAFHIASISSEGSERHLFGLAQEKGLTVFDISAKQMDSEFAKTLMKTAPGISIDGHEFSKAVARQQKSGDLTVWTVMYSTVIDSYLLQFRIYSSDANIAEDLQHCVEATDFFDPTKAKSISGKNSIPYNPVLPSQPAQKMHASTGQLVGERDKAKEDEVAKLVEATRNDAKLPRLTRIRHRDSLEQLVCTIAQAGTLDTQHPQDRFAFYRTSQPQSISAELARVASFKEHNATNNLAYPRYSVAVWQTKDSRTGEMTYWVGVKLYWSALEEFIDYHFTDDAFYHDLWKENVASQCRGK